MFRNNTLFVVGAGASHELGLPLGAQLQERISRLFQVVFRSSAQTFGEEFEWPADDEFYRALYGVQTWPIDDTLLRRMETWRQIREGIHFSSSIDNYLYNRGDNEEVVQAGKHAIAMVIAECERELSHRCASNAHEWVLQPKPTTWRLGDSRIKAWTCHFAEQCFALVPNDDSAIKHALARSKFIIFNYDRTVEAFIVAAIAKTFARTEADAKRFLIDDDIVHPYGSLGRLSDAALGHFEPAMFKRIRTFTEVSEPASEDAQRIASAIAWADTIVCLGMAFHPQNMKLLAHRAPRAQRILGTSVGLSKSAKASAESSIRLGFGDVNRGIFPEVLLEPMTCTELLAAEAVTLTESG